MLNKFCRSNSTVSTRSGSSSLASLNDIVHEEDEIVSLKVLIPINWLINPRIFM